MMRFNVCFLIIGLLCSGLVFAHGAHVHSSSNATLAIDQNQIEFTMQSPGSNLVGFEHPPRNEDQQSTFEQAVAALESADWVTFEPAAGCDVVAVEVNTPGFRDEQHDHDHVDQEHEHGDHNHDHDHGSKHAEFHLTLRAVCADAANLDWISFALFEGWPDNQEIQLDVLTDRIQQRFVLTADNNRLELN